MNTSLRAKFRVNSVTDFGYNSKQVKLSAVYSNDKNTEDNQFSSATPSGSLEMMITSPIAQDFFAAGDEVYMDFTKIPKKEEQANG